MKSIITSNKTIFYVFILQVNESIESSSRDTNK